MLYIRKLNSIVNDINDNKTIDRLIRIGLLILMVALSFVIIAPFMIMLIWGIIIAVASYPLFRKTVKLLGDKKSLTAILFTIVGLAVIVIPSLLLTTSSATGFQNLKMIYEAGNLTIPQPTQEVKEWPMIGEKLFASWNLASHNMREFLSQNRDQVEVFVTWMLETITSLGLTVLQFIVSIIIAGVLLAKADGGEETTGRFAKRLLGDKSDDFVQLIGGTIRSVVQGVLGIALIQAFASALLLAIFGVPIPGLWALFILILAIMQLPPLLILGPIVVYVFSVQDTVPATIFTVFALVISMSDSLLKPIFLGRGVDIPMMVVLIGAIGGMLVFGILGLFVGAVILALSYKLMMAWLHESA